MPKVEAYQTHYKIQEYNMGDNTLIENTLSYWNDSYKRREYIALSYDETNKILMIPRGYPQGILEKGFNLNYLHIEREYTKPKETLFRMTSTPRDDDQRRIIAFLMGEMEYKYTKKYSQLAINLKTGKGKTFCTLAFISLCRMKSVIIVHDTNVALQWRKAIEEHTELSPEDVIDISGSDSIDKLMKQKHPNGKIYIAIHDTITSYASRSEKGWNIIDKVFTHLGIGIKVYDEAHKCFENIMMTDFHTNVWKTVYLSATLGRSREQASIFNYAFSQVPVFGKELTTVDDIHAIALIMEYNTNPSLKDVTKCKKKQGFSSILFTDYLFSDMYRTQAFFNTLYESVEFCLRREGKVCILMATKAACQYTKELLEERYPNIGKVGVFNSSITDKELRRKETECRIFISTSNSMTAAMDISDLSFMIMTEPFSSLINQEQIVGRLRPIENRQLYYIELLNIGFKDMVKQHKVRRKALTSLVAKIFDMKQKIKK